MSSRAVITGLLVGGIFVIAHLRLILLSHSHALQALKILFEIHISPFLVLIEEGMRNGYFASLNSREAPYSHIFHL